MTTDIYDTGRDFDVFPVDNMAEPTLGEQTGPALINVHKADQCVGEHCVIHNPSEHHMRGWALNWRSDRALMERTCPMHGTGHPDPDDLAFHVSQGRDYMDVHGCCGCCQPPSGGSLAEKGIDGPGQGGNPLSGLQEALPIPEPAMVV